MSVSSIAPATALINGAVGIQAGEPSTTLAPKK